MTISHSPAPARSDVAAPAATRRGTTRPYARHGRMVSIGAAAWAASMVFFGGLNPETELGLVAQGIGAGLFQAGLLALLRVLWLTRALGGGRLARAVLRVEAVLVGFAMASTFVDAIGISDLSQPGWAVLDAFWPFSMLGMFFIGIRVAVAGRWRGLSRYWPVVAESWAVVVIPTLGIFGAAAAEVVAPLHLLVGYTVLGLLVARKER